MKLKLSALAIACIMYTQTQAMYSPLGEAIWAGNFDEVKKIIDPQSDNINELSAQVFAYESPLRTAMDALGNNQGPTDADKQNIRLIIEYLVGKKTPLNKKQGFFSVLPIHLAARRGENELLKLFITNGADINNQGYLGKTPLHEAIEQAQFEAAKILLDAGADTSIKNDMKLTPYALLLEKLREGVNPDVGIPLEAQEEALLNLQKIKKLFDMRSMGQGFQKISSSLLGKSSTDTFVKFE